MEGAIKRTETPKENNSFRKWISGLRNRIIITYSSKEKTNKQVQQMHESFLYAAKTKQANQRFSSGKETKSTETEWREKIKAKKSESKRNNFDHWRITSDDSIWLCKEILDKSDCKSKYHNLSVCRFRLQYHHPKRCESKAYLIRWTSFAGVHSSSYAYPVSLKLPIFQYQDSNSMTLNIHFFSLQDSNSIKCIKIFVFNDVELGCSYCSIRTKIRRIHRLS